MQRNFFHLGDPPPPQAWPKQAPFFRFLKMFQVFLTFQGGKNHFFHKNPPLVVLSPKNITCFFSTKANGGRDCDGEDSLGRNCNTQACVVPVKT